MNNLYDLDELDEQIRNAQSTSPSIFKKLLSILKKIIFISILPILIYLIFTYIIGITCIDIESMMPNFSQGDYIFYNRFIMSSNGVQPQPENRANPNENIPQDFDLDL